MQQQQHSEEQGAIALPQNDEQQCRADVAVDATYRNPWFNHASGCDPEFYRTSAKPIEYRGYKVYQRIPGRCWDFVKDGVCVRQMAGGREYKAVIDATIAANAGPHDHGDFLLAFNGGAS